MRESQIELKVRKRDQSVVAKNYKRDSRDRDSRARRDVGTLRLSARVSPKVSLGHVLAHHSSHLEHVNLGDRQDGLQLVIGLNDAAVVQLLGLDVDPEFLNASGRVIFFPPQIA